MSKNKQFKAEKDGLEAIKTKKTTITAEGIIKELLEPKQDPINNSYSEVLKSIGVEPVGDGQEQKIKKKRGGNPENLKLGRQKLAETWEEKRRMKEELIQKAIDKKINLALKQKEQIYKHFDVKSDSEEEEEIMEPVKAPRLVVLKKPVKTRVKKYIEISEEEEEPEIIYKKKVVNNTPKAVQRGSNIIFY